ncbi:hypothetical protein Q3G72_017492 [Acer saccharum]|nr:hypothetical protein Q3G72_017492 [Acer saccharum]
MFDLLLSSHKFASACKDMVLSCWVYSALSGMYFLARWLKKSTKYSTSNISNKDLNYGNYWGLKATTSHKKESIKSGSLGSSAQRSLATATTL